MAFTAVNCLQLEIVVESNHFVRSLQTNILQSNLGKGQNIIENLMKIGLFTCMPMVVLSGRVTCLLLASEALKATRKSIFLFDNTYQRQKRFSIKLCP